VVIIVITAIFALALVFGPALFVCLFGMV